MKNYKPYQNYTNTQLRQMLYTQSLGVPSWVIILINMSFDDEWDPVNDYNGCSVVQDKYHPDVACYLHDWLYICGYDIPFANKLFKRLMLLTGYSRWMAWRRYLAVVIAGNVYFKWLGRKSGKYTTKIIKDKIKD